MITIKQVDMHYRDERALALLRESINPETQRSALTLIQLAERLGCNRNTAGAITNRLQGAGYIKKHRSAGRGGADIEVLCKDA